MKNFPLSGFSSSLARLVIEKTFTSSSYIIFHLFVLTTLISPQDTNNKNTNTFDSNWQFMGLQNEGITTIAVDWADSNVIYSGSGSSFSSGTVGGIFKTTNGGITWDTLIRGVTVRDLDIHPNNPQIIYATLGLNALTQPGIIKTTDGGNSWVKADYGIHMSWESGPVVLAIDSKQSDTLYTGTDGPFGGYPYKSINGGETWFRIDPDTNWVWRKTLSGDSSLVDPLEDGISSIAVDFTNNQHIYLGTAGLGEIFYTYDGGKNWNITGLTEQDGIYDIEVDPYSSEKVYAGTSRNGFLISTDTGFNWQSINSGLPDSSEVKSIEISNNRNNQNMFIIATQGGIGGIYRNVNFNKWEKVGIENKPIYTIKLFLERIYAGSNGIYVKDIITEVCEDISTPLSANLYPNYPNPFNSNTNIKYVIEKEENVTIEIYNILGERIKTLLSEIKLPGEYITHWNGTDDIEKTVSSGLYICILICNNKILNTKIIYLK